jgi:2-dehydropantoate 2-reductase
MLKDIKTLSIVGLGSLGIMYGHHFSMQMQKSDLKIVADPERIEKYRQNSIYCNGGFCDFNYVSSQEKQSPVDLLLFTVKFNDLEDAIQAARGQVGPDTIILSLLNGISSEEIIGRKFGMEKIIYSVAQGMDPIKTGNMVRYHHMGLVCFGGNHPGVADKKALAVARFFDKTKLPYEIEMDMRKKLWGKFMLNVGVNQAVAVFECDYGGILREGLARDTMIQAMREVMVLSEKENVGLSDADLDYWLKVLEGLNAAGKPSMRQDLEARRKSEVELFAGTVLALSRKHHVQSPVNQMLYDKIKGMESDF